MNRKLKRALRSAFIAPEAARKDEFIQSLPFPKTRYFDFVCSQTGYIRKRVWILSGVLPLGILCIMYLLPFDDILSLIWLISSVLPFIALIAIIEISRSTAYGMAELEMSCKYSLSDITLVRLSIPGVFNFIIFTAVLLLFAGKTNYSLLRLEVYIFSPFLLSCTLSLIVLNHLRTRETSYVCGGISCIVSMFNVFLANPEHIILTDRFFILWVLVFSALIFGFVIQITILIRKTEEPEWSLQLTD